jgi:malonate transporter
VYGGALSAFVHYLGLSTPLFALVIIGYGVARLPFWQKSWTVFLGKFVFAVPLPALLFHMMSDLDGTRVLDARPLFAFFGSCLIVFALGRAIAGLVFRLDGVSQSVFALGGVFSNNVLLGVPLARLTLGAEALPCVALILVFNALTLWTLVTVSVEWARHGSLSLRGFGNTALSVLSNPIIVGIVGGVLFSLSGWSLPGPLTSVLSGVGKAAGPLALLSLGLSISQYGVRRELQQSLAICGIKLLVQPVVVWGLAVALGLPLIDRQVVVLLGSLAVGANVHLMAARFEVMQGQIASSLVLSTVLAAFTTPLLLAFSSALP